MKLFLESIFTQLRTYAPSIKHMAVYNSQYENIRDPDPEKGYLFEMPAVFIELDLSSIKQMGGGYQLIEPLPVTVHIVVQELDSGTGTLDQNYNIFDVKDEVLLALQTFRPYQGGQMFRESEYQDYTHQNMYVYKQVYITTYVDPVPKDIIRGIEATTPPIEIINTFENETDYLLTEDSRKIETEAGEKITIET